MAEGMMAETAMAGDQVTLSLSTEKMIARKGGGIGWIVFNQPEKRNAVSVEMWQAVEQIAADFAADEAVRVVVITGAGERAFVSGADISQFEKLRGDADAQAEYEKMTAAGRAALAAMDKPSIAMIRGYCIGGGLAIALGADIRIASDDSRFAVPAAKLGLAYNSTGLKRLIDLVGPAQAKEIMFTARQYDAGEALRIGLVNRIVPVEALAETVGTLATTIANNAPLTIRAARVTINEMLKDAAERDTARMQDVFRACFDSTDYKEGRRAFMEKRTPVFTGS
ncbi:enoyl-CoA hydratase [Elioraea sp.]|uniref:enoyl-CoA hydratase n=1 Tax=Elioraea sp. TaxID=2185103 RepID=UPI0025C4A326|nr:enoyl-CoA hydratase [Elioraea sp.]